MAETPHIERTDATPPFPDGVALAVQPRSAGSERSAPAGFRVPSTHRQAERLLVRLVESGEWEIDDEGRVWRVAMRSGLKTGGSHVVPVARRRAEHDSGDYFMLRAVLDGRRVYGLAHRVVWQWSRGDIPDGLCLNHINGDKRDNRLSNLEVVTYSENIRHDFHNRGTRTQRGEANNQARLTAEQVVEIRRRRAAGEQLLPIAADFGIAIQTVSKIARGNGRHDAAGPVSTEDGRLVCRRARGADGRFLSEEADGGDV